MSMMRLSLVLPSGVVVSALGWILIAVTPLGAQVAQEGREGVALAESVIAREEAASERAFDPSFRAKAKELLASLPLAELLSQKGENGLGLNTLGDSQADLVYTPVTPCRIIDTRSAGGTLSPGVPRSFKVTGDTTSQGGADCGIPFGPATSAMINFVAVSPTGKGNMQITPSGQAMPTASFINFSNTAGTNLANGLAVALCNPSAATCTNDITIQANNSAVDLVADVQGYYQRVTPGGVGSALLADGAVTAPKIGSGVVVRSLNGLTDAVTLAAGTNVSITPSGNTLTVSATPDGAGGDITAVNTPAGGGLQGGVTSGDASLGLQGCGSGQVLKSNGSTWSCGSDIAGGDITAVNTPAGGGLQGGVTSGDASLGLQACGSGQVLKSNGSTWSCGPDIDTDTNTTYSAGSGLDLVSGVFSVDPTDFNKVPAANFSTGYVDFSSALTMAVSQSIVTPVPGRVLAIATGEFITSGGSAAVETGLATTNTSTGTWPTFTYMSDSGYYPHPVAMSVLDVSAGTTSIYWNMYKMSGSAVSVRCWRAKIVLIFIPS
jgi:hypothetical protein